MTRGTQGSAPDSSHYRVALITLTASQVVGDTVFIDGFVQNGEVIGRPVDIAFLADGSMLVSDAIAARFAAQAINHVRRAKK